MVVLIAMYKAGDFGTLDRKSGQLVRDGNVYEEAETSAVAAQYPTETGPEESIVHIKSHRARMVDTSAGVSG